MFGQRCAVLEELSKSCTKLCRDPFHQLKAKLPTYVREAPTHEHYIRDKGDHSHCKLL